MGEFWTQGHFRKLHRVVFLGFVQAAALSALTAVVITDHPRFPRRTIDGTRSVSQYELALLNHAAPLIKVFNDKQTTMPGVRVAARDALKLVHKRFPEVAQAVYGACNFNATDLVLENNVRLILEMAPKSDAKAQARMRAASSPWRKDPSSFAARRATAQP